MTDYSYSSNKYRKKKRKQKQKNLLLFLTFMFLIVLGILIGKKKQDAEAGQNGAGLTEATDELQNAGLEIHYLDVGQGDATLILCEGHAMLIDAGNNDMGTTVQLYLKRQGIKTLDYLIGTHPDADHIGGLDVVLSKFDCDVVMMPDVQRDNATYRDVIETMAYRRYENTVPVLGRQYRLGGAVFTIVAPDGSYEEEYNNTSIGILLEYGQKRFLFVGDAESAAEQKMLKSGLDIHADVLKIGHHGSSDSTSQEFLDAVNPTYAVISCGKNNDYGHPHERTLKTLKKRDISMYRTDEQGGIVLQSDGSVISFLTEPSVLWKSGWELQDRR